MSYSTYHKSGPSLMFQQFTQVHKRSGMDYTLSYFWGLNQTPQFGVASGPGKNDFVRLTSFQLSIRGGWCANLNS